ncbi:hypothetical protein [Streptomyces yaizuensis]|uniref:Uncharacterized protein n=1 Tax=Streptomyces yaizuensis TaxID=2989713 RepID=A0ABQ5NSR0_9ACTN|nr:hypothetical protein [Streptomyces sp. YSPA8]GLF93204.1 hypothetical protein SYYSPA8_02925 [Streptomyces sp. YSPA8]
MDPTLIPAAVAAGALVALAYFALVARVVTTLARHRRLPVVLASLIGLLGVLPAILYALSQTPAAAA